MTPKSAVAASVLLLALFTLSTIPAAQAQTPAESPKPAPARPESASWPIHTYYLKTDDQATMNDIATILRNAIGTPPGSAIVPDLAQKAIVIREDPADIPYVEKILADIDRPRNSYRVTYTLSEMDNNKRIGTQHFAVVMVSGQRTQFQQGSKVPVANGAQFSYVDVDLRVTATLQDVGTSGSLQYELDQDSIAPETSATLPQPIVRHTSLTGQATLTPGKPLLLGSIDFPGSTRRIDVEALMEPLP